MNDGIPVIGTDIEREGSRARSRENARRYIVHLKPDLEVTAGATEREEAATDCCPQ
jgi:hypothetical protein